MGKQSKRRFSGSEKVAILKRHLVNGESIADICDDLRLNPNLFYRWQKTFFENGAKAFEVSKASPSRLDRKMAHLKDKLAERDGVISELVTELIKSKKNDGGL